MFIPLNSLTYQPREKNLAVLLSGGVDSSTTAYLLQQAGWNIVGVYMKIPSACGNSSDATAAVAVAAHLQIPLFALDVAQVFHTDVIAHFRNAYQRGITPNPCVDCNQNLKFGYVWETLRREIGIEHLATGHYAQTLVVKGQTLLGAAVNAAKDQSYFVYGVPSARLPFLHLPLGGLSKTATRELAARAKIPTAMAAESMELCFAGGGDYRRALPPDLPNLAGDFCDQRGKKIGTHRGIMHYTVGQRKLGVSLGAKPHYVLQLLPPENKIIVGTYHDALREKVRARWRVKHQAEKIYVGAALWGKIRSGAAYHECVIENCDNENVQVKFVKAVFAPTPGQHLVLYDAEHSVVGGGEICA